MSSVHQLVALPREIVFNSRSSADNNRWCGLSNFYGGVEFEYIAQRYSGDVAKLLFDMDQSDAEQFLKYLKQLQPNKKWTERKEAYWFREGEPICGILAKLVGNAVKDPKRMKVLQSMVDKVVTCPEVSDGQKLQQMAFCLEHKYALEPWRSLLLATGDAIIHEKPLRGNGQYNNWTYHRTTDKQCKSVIYGGDWLGKMLMWVRGNIVGDYVPLSDYLRDNMNIHL